MRPAGLTWPPPFADAGTAHGCRVFLSAADDRVGAGQAASGGYGHTTEARLVLSSGRLGREGYRENRAAGAMNGEVHIIPAKTT
jgi:hypothetical protein